jgi:putative glutamine amidotransferase
MILLGVSSCFFYPDPARTVFGHKTLQYFERDMARYLMREDVLPVLIPDVAPASLEKIFDRLDGLVLQGGSDLSPESYGEDFLDKSRWPGDRYRDAYELRLVDEARRRRLPVLGICRGAQLINVYFGGTLYQDLSTQLGTEILHRDAQLYDRISHPVEIMAGGLLEKIYGDAGEIIVNSVHHQGIKSLGKSLCVEAVSPLDHLVEAVSYENPEEFFCLGVQWHPEFSTTLGDAIVDPQPLYESFLTVVRRRS